MNSSMAFSISVVNSRMAFSISVVKSPHIHLHTNPISLHLSSSSPPFILCFPSHLFLSNRRPRIFVPKSASSHSSSSQDAYGSDLLRKPVNSPVSEAGVEESTRDSDVEEESKRIEEEGWVDWEDQILEDTVPLVGFVRMILHSGKYESGDRLSPEHERTILERLLPYHPECEKKIGSGVDYITVGYHPDFESSRCLFIARKDGQLVDFSYWKCLKGLIKKNYPLYADSFILRHFRQRTRSQ